MKSKFQFFNYALLFSLSLFLGIPQFATAEEPKANNNMKENAKTNNSNSMKDRFKVGEFCWTELATNDVAKAKEFYSKTFGWKFTEHPVDDMTYTMVSVNGNEFAGIWAIPKDKEKEISPHWMAYILVDDVDKALEKANKNGAITLKPVSTAGEYGRLAVIKDPTGAAVALWQPTMKQQ